MMRLWWQHERPPAYWAELQVGLCWKSRSPEGSPLLPRVAECPAQFFANLPQEVPLKPQSWPVLPVVQTHVAPVGSMSEIVRESWAQCCAKTCELPTAEM
jgi:hypothetical protein